MRKRVIVPVLFLAAFIVPLHVMPTAQALLTGLVCITFPSTLTSCPSSPPTIGPLSVGQSFSVGVFIQNSEPMGGFDIWVATDSAVLNPMSASLGTLIANPISNICINDVAVDGGSCSPGPPAGPDGQGVVEFSAFDASGSNECGNVAPCSGLAFTITYNVVGAASSASIFYPSSGFCYPSAVISNPNACVLVENAQGSQGCQVTFCENIQGANVVTSSGVKVSKFFTDSSLNPLAFDRMGNPMVNVVLAEGFVRSTNPGEVLAWVNVTNTGFAPLQSIKLNDTLPVDWLIHPDWVPGQGAIHVYYANTTSLATNPEITDPKTVTVTPGNPEIVHVAIPRLIDTAIGHALLPGQSILVSVKLQYGLRMTTQSLTSYPRNYTDTATATDWLQPNYAGIGQSGTGSAFFTAYASVEETELVTIGQIELRIVLPARSLID